VKLRYSKRALEQIDKALGYVADRSPSGAAKIEPHQRNAGAGANSTSCRGQDAVFRGAPHFFSHSLSVPHRVPCGRRRNRGAAVPAHFAQSVLDSGEGVTLLAPPSGNSPPLASISMTREWPPALPEAEQPNEAPLPARLEPLVDTAREATSRNTNPPTPPTGATTYAGAPARASRRDRRPPRIRSDPPPGRQARSNRLPRRLSRAGDRQGIAARHTRQTARRGRDRRTRDGSRPARAMPPSPPPPAEPRPTLVRLSRQKRNRGAPSSSTRCPPCCRSAAATGWPSS